MQMQMKIFDRILFSALAFTTYTIVLADIRIPQPLPKGTPEPPLIKMIEGHYLVVGPKYKGTAYIVKPPESQVYLVYQYSGSTVTKGIGFMTDGCFVIGWEQEKAIGVTSIRFRDGNGRASWTSNPGTGRVSQETWRLIDDEE